MSDYFSPLKGARILVVGDLILDRYVHGDTSRISPEAPVPIVKVQKTEECPGGAANVALNIRALGLDVQLLGVCGNDAYSDTLISRLQEAGVEYDFIRQQGFPTITKLRVLSQNQQLLRLDYEAAAEELDVLPLHALYKHYIGRTDVLVLSDYAKGTLKNVSELIEEAKLHKVTILVDPKGRDFTPYRGASYLTPNLKEFEAVAGYCKTNEDLVNKAMSLCDSLSLDGLLVTRGGEGMSLIDAANKTSLHLPAQNHEVFDVTGAGDTVIAVLAASLASAYDLKKGIGFANQAAGLVVEKLGAASISVDELNAAIAASREVNSDAGIVRRDELDNVLSSARRRNEKIVMTNGCFDILHAGHVDYLQQSKLLGDRLFVAVNDDDSVKRLKGDSRPVNELHSRMSVLAALTSVDWVCSFREDTPEALIKIIRPDILVKGADYTEANIVGAEFVRSYGGEVITIPFKKQCSTSAIIEKLQAVKLRKER